MKEHAAIKKNVEIALDDHGQKLVRINAITFKGKRGIDWNEVEKYLQQFVGDIYEIADSNDFIYGVTETKKETDTLFGSEDLTQ